MIGVMRLQISLKLPVGLNAVNERLVAALHTQNDVHGATAEVDRDLAAWNEAEELARTLCVQRQRLSLPLSRELNLVKVGTFCPDFYQVRSIEIHPHRIP